MSEQEIAAELLASRKAAGLPREKVAQAMRVSMKTIERWEKTGRVGPFELREIRSLYADVTSGTRRLDNDVPRGTSEDEWEPNPTLRNLIPERAYSLALDYCRRLLRARVSTQFIDEAERLMIDGRYAQMNRRSGRDLTEGDWMRLVDATWEIIRETLHSQGIAV